MFTTGEQENYFCNTPYNQAATAPTVISYVYSPPIVAAGGIGVPGSEAREPLQLTPCLMSIGTRLVKYDPWTGAVLVQRNHTSCQ